MLRGDAMEGPRPGGGDLVSISLHGVAKIQQKPSALGQSPPE